MFFFKKACGGKSDKIYASSSSSPAAGWKDVELVIATVPQRSGSRAVNPNREDGE